MIDLFLEKKIIDLDLASEYIPSKIHFNIDEKTFLSMTSSGFVFHIDNFPEWTPTDFEKAFIKCLEDNFDVQFIYKNKMNSKNKKNRVKRYIQATPTIIRKKLLTPLLKFLGIFPASK